MLSMMHYIHLGRSVEKDKVIYKIDKGTCSDSTTVFLIDVPDKHADAIEDECKKVMASRFKACNDGFEGKDPKEDDIYVHTKLFDIIRKYWLVGDAVKLRNLGHENLDPISDINEDSWDMKKHGMNVPNMKSIANSVYFNPDVPENHIIRFAGPKKNVIEIYENNCWVPYPMKKGMEVFSRRLINICFLKGSKTLTFETGSDYWYSFLFAAITNANY
jgi:hypothetical protein